MINSRTLSKVFSDLYAFVPDELCITDWDGYTQHLEDLDQCYTPVHPPRVLGKSRLGNDIYHLRVGNGPLHTVIDVIPHGGEVLWLAASTEYVMFLCDEHPELLQGRTIDLLFAGPDEAIVNLEGWAKLLTHPDDERYYLRASILNHHRNPDPLKNDWWSYPFWRDDEFVNYPTSGALAGMRLIQEIHDAGEEIVLWCSGHNKHIGTGVQFQYSGPPGRRTRRTARQFEPFAAALGIPLDLCDPEGRYQQLYLGTQATYTVDNATSMYRYDSTARTGGTPFDWAKQFFPKMSAQLTELSMFLMRDFGPYRVGVRRSRAESIAVAHRKRIDEELLQTAELARSLPPDDPDVSAVRGLAEALGSWGTRTEPTDPNELLTPHRAFQLATAGPLYTARKAGPAIRMLNRYADEIGRSVAEALASQLRVSALVSAELLGYQLELLPLKRAVVQQIAACEVAYWGALGIHPEQPIVVGGGPKLLGAPLPPPPPPPRPLSKHLSY